MRLRPLEKKDAQGMLSWMHDSNIARFFTADFAKFDVKKVYDFIEHSNDDRTSAVHYACVNDVDEYLGTVSLKNITLDAKNAEYAISFCKAAQGTGAAKFATDEILRIAFIEMGLERVYLNVLSENIRANKFYQKYGFIYEGEFKKHLFIRGNLFDLKWYRMLKDEYFSAAAI